MSWKTPHSLLQGFSFKVQEMSQNKETNAPHFFHLIKFMFAFSKHSQHQTHIHTMANACTLSLIEDLRLQFHDLKKDHEILQFENFNNIMISLIE